MRPEPTSVRYNDWRQVDVPPADSFEPTDPVSVVIPYYQTPDETKKTLAALERQTYPRELFEVVVVDDGSEPPFEAPGEVPFQINVARQERRGFRLARARNLGARTAAHDILLFLDSDMLPEAGWIAAHARWHHVLSDALTVGIRKSVATDDVDADAIRERQGSLAGLYSSPPVAESWIEHYLSRTDDLTSKDDELFSAVLGAHFGIRREFYDAIGGSDESYRRWGQEDRELSYRVYAHGGLLVPMRDTMAWHQGLDSNRQAKRRSIWINRGKSAHRIPHWNYRSGTPGRFFAVSMFVVTLDARRLRADQAVRRVAKVLADPVHDLVVRVEAGQTDDDRVEYIRNELGPDPRVRVNPTRSVLDEFSASAFHVELPGSAVFARGLIDRLEAELDDAVEMVSVMPDGSRLTITRMWALHRARRTGFAPATFGDVRSVPATRLRATVAAPAHSSGDAILTKIVRYPAWSEVVGETFRSNRGFKRAFRAAWFAANWRWRRLAYGLLAVCTRLSRR